VQLVPIRVPAPRAAIPWQTDERGRKCAPIPAFGEIVELTAEEAVTAREKIAASGTLPVPLVFEIEFLGGSKGLFMARDQVSIVEGKNGSSNSVRSSAG
jgi:hypothetical protein